MTTVVKVALTAPRHSCYAVVVTVLYKDSYVHMNMNGHESNH